jgi:hypothetical protein
LFGLGVGGYLQSFPHLYREGAMSRLGLGQYAGMGDVDLAANDARAQAGANDVLTRSFIDLDKELGGEELARSLERLKSVDPDRWKLNEALTKLALGDLQRGDSLNDSERTNLEENVRGSQIARGNYLGGAPSADEVLAKFNLGQQLKQQRISNAGNVLNSDPYRAQEGVLNGAQLPYQKSSWTGGMQPDQNIPAQGAQTQYNAWRDFNQLNQQQFATRTSGWASALAHPQTSFGEQLPGMLAGLASSAIGAGARRFGI